MTFLIGFAQDAPVLFLCVASGVTQMLVPLLSHTVTRSFTYNERAQLFPLQVVLLVCQISPGSHQCEVMSVIAKQFLLNMLTFAC